jgi:hypothetical protein
MRKMVQHTNIPYQFDVTNTTNVVNIIVEKIIELARDNHIALPEDCAPFVRVDLAEIADAMRKVADWQAYIVRKAGLSEKLIPRVYEQCDYGSIISYSVYYGDKINTIIDALETQEPPEHYGLEPLEEIRHGSY